MEEEINNYYNNILDNVIKENEEKDEKWRKEVVPGLRIIFCIFTTIVISHIMVSIFCWF